MAALACPVVPLSEQARLLVPFRTPAAWGRTEGVTVALKQ
jgi:hypothetical protein